MGIQQVEINLLGQRLYVSCPDGEKPALMEAVRFLEARMRSIREAGRVVDVGKIALLAALNITHDYLHTKVAGSDVDLLQFQGKIEAMSRLIDEVLDPDADEAND